jgi:hypothetical protein
MWGPDTYRKARHVDPIPRSTAKNVPVGAEVHFQFWSRDSGFPAPNAIGLTNALKTEIHP